MFVALNVVEHENRAVTWWKLLYSTFKIYPIHRPREPQIRSSDIFARSAGVLVRLGRLFERGLRKGLLAKTHQHHVHSQAMQPSGKRRLTPEGPDLTKKLQKSFLRKVFCFRRVSHHPQAERVNAPIMQPIDAFKSLGVALLCPSDGLRFA